MANKVDVFTEELSKVFTILQQQYVIIKYMKALITSGELDKTEINKLNEQVTKMNNKLNSIIDDKLVMINQNIMRIDNNITEIEKVMPTDINADIDGNLILEHDGIEITGQKKQVAVYTKDQVNALINDAGLPTFTLVYPYTGTFPSANHKQTSITYSDDIITVYNCINYVKENGACFLKMRNVIHTSTGITELNPVFVLCLLAPNSDTSTIECYGTTGEYMFKLVSNGDTTSQNNTFIIYDKIVKAIDVKNIYRHQLQCITDDNSQVFCVIMSSNNLKINSIQDLTNVTKASQGYEEICYIINDPRVGSIALLKYNGTIWQITRYAEDIFTYNIKSITDTVTTI